MQNYADASTVCCYAGYSEVENLPKEYTLCVPTNWPKHLSTYFTFLSKSC